MTPHINAKLGDFASVVLMPGDPLRAKFIAEEYLNDVKEITNIRNMLGYTGYYKNCRVSVMAHGMGMASCSIYATELYRYFGVDTIIRLGSAGGYSETIQLGDIIVGQAAFCDSNINRIRFDNTDIPLFSNFQLLRLVDDVARKKGINIHVGTIFSTDLYYFPERYNSFYDKIESYGVVGAEMEAAGLYGAAIEAGKKAIALCTISEHSKKGQSLSASERVNSFTHMITLALETALFIESQVPDNNFVG
jgi:purine-nucleoside phosphorylase